MNNKALHTLSYGVYVISTWDKERPTGCIANSTMQITSDPATIAISINHDNYTKQCIEEDGRFAISILPENCDPSIIGTFGFKSGKNVDKFDTIAYELKGNLPIIQKACAYITCSVVNRMETDTHTVFFGKVYDADILTENEPMTYSYYHKVIKGKSPKNAPTYVAEEMSENIKPQKYICSVCNYEYSGDIPFEELPDDYTCPICGLPKTVFRKYE